MTKNIYKPGKYVITGGPCAGKSTLISALRAKGFHGINEPARDLISLLIREDSPLLPWRNKLGFRELLVAKTIEVYLSAPSDVVCFFECAQPENIAYYQKDGYTPIEACINSCFTQRFDKIFICPPWKEIFENDEVRKETFEESVVLHDLIRNAYLNLRYSLTEVPKSTIEKRVEFVLTEIRQYK